MAEAALDTAPAPVQAPPLTIAQALSAVMGEVQNVSKDSRNTQGSGYNYRGIDAVVNAVGPALRKWGVIVMPTVLSESYREIKTSKGAAMELCAVRVRYTFHGPAGDKLSCSTIGEAFDSGDKAAPKAMSVAYRVALLQALCIPTDEPDVDSFSHERERAKPEPKPSANGNGKPTGKVFPAAQRAAQAPIDPKLAAAKKTAWDLIVNVFGAYDWPNGEDGQPVLNQKATMEAGSAALLGNGFAATDLNELEKLPAIIAFLTTQVVPL
ncbi:MAG: ERF family protein [Anaerolineae bacterium]